MAKIKAFDLKRGKIILYEGEMYSVFSTEIVSKGNWRSSVQVKMKSLKSGRMSETRMSTDDNVETPFVETRPFTYLYREGNNFVVMDQSSYDQIPIDTDVMGEDATLYLKGDETVVCQFIDGKIVSVELPNTVELRVTDTPPVVRGATATNQTKEAVLETGARVRVPPFIENGELLRIDTRSGEYLERAKEDK